VTAHTSEIETALECCRVAKKILPDCITVGGGIHLTMFPEAATDSGVVDFVVRGEGEVTLPKLVASPGTFPRVCWGETPNLDRIPFEDRELYPDYAQRTRFPLWHLPTPIVDLLTQRGCPWQCRFCCGPGEQNLYTKPVADHPDQRLPALRHRSVSNVVSEMHELDEKYAFRGVVFHDDQFLIRRDWVEEFCEALHQEGFVKRGVRWWAASRADIICKYPELIAEMRRAGLQIISIGFESFSDRMLKWMRKDTTVAQNREAARICSENELDIFANVIFGMPYSDGRWYLEDDLASLEAMHQIRPRYFSPSFFSPIPGSWFYEWVISENILINDTHRHLGTRTPDRARVKTVDYGTLNQLLEEYRRQQERALRSRETLRRRVRRFLSMTRMSGIQRSWRLARIIEDRPERREP
jgi:radical SAM superfamily enzyme YgiQ (UPF0313 family)